MLHGGDQVVGMELTLPGPASTLVVFVEDVEGDPVSGAVVSVGRWNTIDRSRILEDPPPLFAPPTGWTDARGRCELWGVPQYRGFVLTVKHPELGTVFMRVDSEAESEVRVTLEGRCQVRGRVLDVAGKPVPQARITCTPLELHGGIDLRSGLATAQAKTLDDGSFVLEDVPSGGVRVSARFEELGQLEENFELAPGDELEIELRFQKQLASEVHQLVGTVTTPSGAPGTDLLISLTTTEPRTIHSARTDMNGRFEIARCPSGPVSVRVLDGRSRPAMSVLHLGEIELGDTVSWQLEEELERGDLRVDLGSAPAGTPMELSLTRHGRATRFDVLVSSTSEVVLRNLVPGSYELGVTGYEIAEPAEVPSGGIGTVAVDLP